MTVLAQPLLALFRPRGGRVTAVGFAIRLAWLAVAALHVWLIAERALELRFGGAMDYLRAGLCLLGVVYATWKFWRRPTVFDSTPRRAWSFALALLLGHWLIAPPGEAPAVADKGLVPAAVILVITPALLLLGLGLMRGRGHAYAAHAQATRTVARPVCPAIPGHPLLASPTLIDLPPPTR